MKKLMTIFILLLIVISGGCRTSDLNSVEVTEEEAKQMVIEEHGREDNNIEITSVVNNPNKYIIQWEIKPIQKGKDSVDKETGNIKAIESSTGPCKWF